MQKVQVILALQPSANLNWFAYGSWSITVLLKYVGEEKGSACTPHRNVVVRIRCSTGNWHISKQFRTWNNFLPAILQQVYNSSSEHYCERVIDNTTLLVYNVKNLIFPKVLQRILVSWYYHYLQHPGHRCLKDTIETAMNWRTIEIYKKWFSAPISTQHQQDTYLNRN